MKTSFWALVMLVFKIGNSNQFAQVIVVGFILKLKQKTFSNRKKSGEHPEKIWVKVRWFWKDFLGEFQKSFRNYLTFKCCPKKIQVVPYKNLGRFYRVPFKPLLRVQIKRATNESLENHRGIDYTCLSAYHMLDWIHEDP